MFFRKARNLHDDMFFRMCECCNSRSSRISPRKRPVSMCCTWGSAKSCRIRSASWPWRCIRDTSLDDRAACTCARNCSSLANVRKFHRTNEPRRDDSIRESEPCHRSSSKFLESSGSRFDRLDIANRSLRIKKLEDDEMIRYSGKITT